MQHQRHLIDRFDVLRRDDAIFLHVAEKGDLPLHLLGNRAIAAAQENVGLDPDGQKLLDAVLCGL